MKYNKVAQLIWKHYGQQAVLAKRLGLTRQTISRWVNEDPMKFMLHAEKMQSDGVDVNELLHACSQSA